MPPELRVDPPLVMGRGATMSGAADHIPEAPPTFSSAIGVDDLSSAIGQEVPNAEAPIIEGLPPLKRGAKETADNIQAAARRYAETDQALSGEYDRHQFDRAGAPGSAGSSGCRWGSRPDGPTRADDEHADAAGRAGCADPHADDGHGSRHTPGHYAGRAKRHAAGWPDVRAVGEPRWRQLEG